MFIWYQGTVLVSYDAINISLTFPPCKSAKKPLANNITVVKMLISDGMLVKLVNSSMC